MSRRFKTPETHAYVKAHQAFMARLEHDAMFIGETHDGTMRAYAERLRPELRAVWCRLQVIGVKPPTTSHEGLAYRLSHNGKHWRENFDLFSLAERYPAEIMEWDRILCGMMLVPGQLPRPRPEP